ncbi:osteocrin [Stigmatopora nigra]
MHFWGWLLFIFLLSTYVSEHNARHLALPRQHGELDVSTRTPHAVARPDSEKTQWRRAQMDNDVKRKTGLRGKASPLDRLSGTIDGQRVILLPGRRVSLPPLDRIRTRHLPNRRG